MMDLVVETLLRFAVLIPWIMAFIAIVTVIFAGFIILFEKSNIFKKHKKSISGVRYKRARRIAVLIATKNGEKTIALTVKAAKKNRRQVYVVSDGSTDNTAAVARKAGARVLALRKNIGKPSALYRGYNHFNLGKRFDAVAILDDDVVIDQAFINESKLAMSDAVAISVGRNITDWPHAQRWNMWLAARSYSYWCYQLTQRRVQSSFNVMNCISGSNSLYRTEVLDQVLSVKTPYIVDDTYWTLETHRLKLGKIVYVPRARAWIQDPTSFLDWYKQNLRWMWGTFQGIFGHQIGSQFNKFHMAYVLLIVEWVLYVLSGPICIWLIFQGGINLLPRQLLILISGYTLWVAAAAISLKRARLLYFVPVIVMVDFIFRALMVHALLKALKHKTVEVCVWNSPKRIDASASA